jgi:hypothetical protein
MYILTYVHTRTYAQANHAELNALEVEEEARRRVGRGQDGGVGAGGAGDWQREQGHAASRVTEGGGGVGGGGGLMLIVPGSELTLTLPALGEVRGSMGVESVGGSGECGSYLCK